MAIFRRMGQWEIFKYQLPIFNEERSFFDKADQYLADWARLVKKNFGKVFKSKGFNLRFIKIKMIPCTHKQPNKGLNK